MKARRWSDNDHYWGPFTFSRSDSRRWGFCLCSGDDDQYPGCSFRLHFYVWSLIIALPRLIQPGSLKVSPKHRHYKDLQLVGVIPCSRLYAREYGVYFTRTYIHIHYGLQTLDSMTHAVRCLQVPWQQKHLIRGSVEDRDGRIIPLPENKTFYQARREELLPSCQFTFRDVDGELVVANTILQRNQWGRGRGRWRWLGKIFKITTRALDVSFNKEVGHGKGGWKGGTLGLYLPIKNGAMHQECFEQWCRDNNVEFLGECFGKSNPSVSNLLW